jgi:hypothetical protein
VDAYTAYLEQQIGVMAEALRSVSEGDFLGPPAHRR